MEKDYDQDEDDFSSQQPPIVQSQYSQFLDHVFAELEKKKLQTQSQNIPLDTVYKGYKTISIQQLEPRKAFFEPFTEGKQLWNKDLVNKINFYQESCPLSYKNENGFFKAFFDAYTNHGEIKITPDDVWLTIMIYFSKYVENHSEELRKAFVKHENKMELIIETFKSGDDNWKEFFEKLIVTIKEKTCEGVTQNLECNFSSTDEFSRLFSTATIMSTYKQYFNYTNMVCICGIQRIHMGGKQQDWELLVKKLDYLTQFDVDRKLKHYVRNLLPVLDQFVQTYKGNAHIQFWNNIYHERKNPKQFPYTPSSFINGWIIRFFTIANELGREVSIEEIDVPIKHVIAGTGKVTQMYLVGGCKGVSVENEKVYRPHFSFAIVEKRKPTKQESGG